MVKQKDSGLRVDYAGGPGCLSVTLAGRLDAMTLGPVWNEVLRRVLADGGAEVQADLSSVDYMDGAGMGLILSLEHELGRHGRRLRLDGLSERHARLLGLFDPKRIDAGDSKQEEKVGLVEGLGRSARMVGRDLIRMVGFVGECAQALAFALRHPERMRWREVALTAQRAGAESLPIVILVGFLMGLIMAFQSAMSLQRFGAEIFVPNMLGLVMFRELGALVTAILLAGRSGAAFAAEIGTMKVNEEVNALVTMGLDPVRFLVAPKVLAAVAVMPLMTMFFNFASLVGGAVVMLSLEFPLASYTSRVFSNLDMVDFFGGLFKAMIFSLLVAGVGCLRGLETGSGAGAVGLSTTSAVVSGIILIAVTDGIFAVSFYYLGI